MRLATLRAPTGTHAARIEDDAAVVLPFPDVGALLASGEDWRGEAAGDGPRHSLDGADFAPLILAPRKIVCLGLNYRSHIEETGRQTPEHPTLFAKFARCLIGARDHIILPPESSAVDWEVELAVIVGRTARRVAPEDASEVIAGFTVINDVSMRDWQFRTEEFLQGKTWDRTTPLGPALVTPDELPGGIAPDLALRCAIDGETMQEARTSDLLFGPAEIMAYLSTVVTLEPGDVIATGTPGGVGAARNPPVFLRDGQAVRSSIEGIGELLNLCVSDEI